MSFTRKKTRLGLAAASVALAATVAPANAAVIYSGVVDVNVSQLSYGDLVIEGTPLWLYATNNLIENIYKTSLVYIPTDTGRDDDTAAVVGLGEVIDASLFPHSYSDASFAQIYWPSEPANAAIEMGSGGIVPFSIGGTSPTGSSTKFGWMRFESGATLESVVLVDYAYEDVARASIRAGDTGISPVPLPASLPLALAGIGLLGWMGRFKPRPA